MQVEEAAAHAHMRAHRHISLEPSRVALLRARCGRLESKPPQPAHSNAQMTERVHECSLRRRMRHARTHVSPWLRADRSHAALCATHCSSFASRARTSCAALSLPPALEVTHIFQLHGETPSAVCLTARLSRCLCCRAVAA